MNAVKAIAILTVHLVILVVGMPGVSFLKAGFLSDATQQERFQSRHGPMATLFATGIADFNRARRPIAHAIGGFQPLFRVRQTWHLYRDGPTIIRRMEIRVDGVPIYRTNDPDLDWQTAVLRNRRIRPMAETLVKKRRAKNRVGLARFIVATARQDFPEAKRIEIVSVWGNRKNAGKPHHRITSSAPDWTLEDRP